MERSFETLMTNKSEEELDLYLVKIKKYTPEAIEAAVAELQKRGRQFSEQELENISLVTQQKRDAEKQEEESRTANTWKKNVVTDADAPVYYSHRAIWGFSVFFTVIFGAVLLSANLKGNRSARWSVIGFGVLYTAAAVVVLNLVERNTGLTVFMNGLGAWLMTSFFWNKYIGKDVKYQAKSIRKPLVISSIITIPILLAIIYRAQQ